MVGRKGSFGNVVWSGAACWPIDTAYYVDEADCDLRWLYRVLGWLPLREMNRAAAVPGLNREDAYALPVLLPSREEQRRIAAVLDASDALRTKRREAITKLDTLTPAIFVDMFGDGAPPVSPGTNYGSDEVRVPITDLAVMGTGHTPNRNREEYWDGDISWVNLNEIRELSGRVTNRTELKITPEGVANSSAVVHPAGTVCFSRTASVGFVTVMGEPMTTSQDFVTWTCGPDLNPTFLMHALLASRDVLRASSSGSTHKTIYVRDAERFRVVLPPRSAQDDFARRIKLLDDLAPGMKHEAAQLDTLFASLQQRAFRGVL